MRQAAGFLGHKQPVGPVGQDHALDGKVFEPWQALRQGQGLRVADVADGYRPDGVGEGDGFLATLARGIGGLFGGASGSKDNGATALKSSAAALIGSAAALTSAAAALGASGAMSGA